MYLKCQQQKILNLTKQYPQAETDLQSKNSETPCCKQTIQNSLWKKVYARK